MGWTDLVTTFLPLSCSGTASSQTSYNDENCSAFSNDPPNPTAAVSQEPEARLPLIEYECEERAICQAPPIISADLSAEEWQEAQTLAENIIGKINLNLSLNNIVSDVRAYALPEKAPIMLAAINILVNENEVNCLLHPCQLDALVTALQHSLEETSEVSPQYLGDLVPQINLAFDQAFYEQTLDLAAIFFRIQRAHDPENPFHGGLFSNDLVNCGGHLDAGDNNTYLYTEAPAMLALMFAYEQSGDQRFLEEAEYGARFLSGLVRTDGSMWSAVFSGYPPYSPTEESTRGEMRPLQNNMWGPTEWGASIAAALFVRCAAHQVGSSQYLKTAEDLGEPLMEGYAQDITAGDLGNNLQGFGALISYNLTLYQIRHDPFYLQRIESLTNEILSAQTCEGYFAFKDQIAFQDYVPHLFIESLYELSQFYREQGLANQASRIETCILSLARFLLSTTDHIYNRVRFLIDGESQMSVPLQPWMTGTNRGANSYILSSANVFAIAYQISGDPFYLQAAEDQLRWVFGRNPFGVSFFTGIGDNLSQYHARLAHDPVYQQIAANGAVPGGIVNGLAERWGSPYIDLAPFPKEPPSWQSNEVWLPHTAWFVLAATRLNSL